MFHSNSEQRDCRSAFPVGCHGGHTTEWWCCRDGFCRGWLQSPEHAAANRTCHVTAHGHLLGDAQEGVGTSRAGLQEAECVWITRLVHSLLAPHPMCQPPEAGSLACSAAFPTILSTGYMGQRRCPEQTRLVGRTPESPTPSMVTPHRKLTCPSTSAGYSLILFSPNPVRSEFAQQTSTECLLSVKFSILLRVEATSDPRGAPTPNNGCGSTGVT